MNPSIHSTLLAPPVPACRTHSIIDELLRFSRRTGFCCSDLMAYLRSRNQLNGSSEAFLRSLEGNLSMHADEFFADRDAIRIPTDDGKTVIIDRDRCRIFVK